MKTILSVNNYYYQRGGAEFVFLEQNRMLENLGWQVVPFSMQNPNNLPSKWSEYFISEIEYGERYTAFQKLNMAVKIIYSRESQSKIKKLLHATQVDICHLHNIYHHISPSVLPVIKSMGIPVILTLHDLKIACPAYKMLTKNRICEECKGGRLYNVIRNRCIKDSLALSTLVFFESVVNRLMGSYDSVDKFIVPSRFYISKLVEWGFDENKFKHVPNFIDIDKYSPQYTPGKRFVYFGRLGPEKGLTTLVESAGLAKVGLDIIGTGPEQERLEALAEKKGVDVRFLGYLSGDKLYDAIKSSRAVVLPSEWYENAPISLLETYALGKPVIAANIGGIPEQVENEKSGYLFKSGSVRELSQRLDYVTGLSDDILESMGAYNRLFIEQHHTRKNYQQNLLAVYQEVGVTL